MEKILLLGEINVNCYIIKHNGKCYLVDPGYEKEKVIQYVKENNLEVLGILLTHGHLDHIGAIDSFKVPVYLHEAEFEIIEDNHKNGFDFFGRVKPYDLNEINLVPVVDGSKIQIDDKFIEVIHTPGHTIGGVCYKLDNDLYTGDTLFNGTVGRWDFPTGDLNVLAQTIVHLIESQDETTNIHPAHGESSTIGHEKMTNPYYLDWRNVVASAYDRQGK